MAKDPRPYVAESRDLSLVAPALQAAIRAVLADLTRQGFDPMVFECLRTPERQWWIYGKGRTAAQCEAVGVPTQYAWPEGGRATNASSNLRSVHGHGLAVDVISESKLWSAPTAFWKALGKSVVAHGLTWGGNWKSPVDVPHLQWKLTRSGVVYAGPSAADRDRTEHQGMVATWHVYHADAP